MALPLSEQLLNDPLYPHLKAKVLQSTGLTYYSDKDVELARRITRRLSTIDAQDCASYLRILGDPLRGPSEIDALIAEVTIGETYFFRHPEHFEALREVVLPDLIVRKNSQRRLRIWCAGCAYGAEPYSLAILLKRDLARQLSGWEVTILGTDINRSSLAVAREGKFNQWTLRSMPEEVRNTCFRKDGEDWRIVPQYKEGVYFQYHNMAEDFFPSPANNLFGLDLIVCRNVMIYFGPELMRGTIRKFHDCLAPGAWLLVGPSEPNMTCFSSFRVVNAPGVTLYQKPDESSPTGVTQAPWRPLPMTYPEIPTPAAVASESAGESAPATLADAMRHGDRGAWESAAECCERLLRQDNRNATVHVYRALVLGQMQRQAEAEASLRLAIWLDRRSVLAHYYLGLSLQSRGDSRQAARSFENALDLLDARSDSDIFAEADGITAGELKKVAKLHLQILREQA